jgi:single-strand DNA-binding protein
MLKAIVVGNIGSEPETKYTADGRAILTFSVASNYRAKNGQGNWDDFVEWIRVTVFGKRAESLAEHLKKGTKVYVDGQLTARPWVDRSDNPRAGLEVIASDVEFMSARQDGQQREPVAATARTPVGASDGGGDLADLPF